jgi:hypothetical protein
MRSLWCFFAVALCELWVADARVCPAGKYGTTSVSAQGRMVVLCFRCPPGKFTLTQGEHGSCRLCPAGRGWQSAAKPCKRCPARQFSTAGAKRGCAACPTGRIGGGGSFGSCTKCVAGRTSVDARKCVDCPAGRFAADAGAPCAACPAGTFGSDDAGVIVSCMPCLPGRFASGAGSKGIGGCTGCPSGRGTHAAHGQTACTTKPCPDGTYGTLTQACTSCPAGCMCTGGALSPCPDGKFQPSSKATSCRACAAGRFRRGTADRTVCQRCAHGHYAPYPGMPACEHCPAGRASVHGEAKCGCTLGYFLFRRAAGVGKTVCRPCAAGEYAPKRNQPSGVPAARRCKSCPLGKFVDAEHPDGPDCAVCPAGLLCRGGVVAECPPGYFCPAGATEPKACGHALNFCPAGSAKAVRVKAGLEIAGGDEDGMTRTHARPCPRGAYCLAGKAHKCKTGKFQVNEGASKCTSCPAGKFASSSAAQACRLCVDGKRSLLRFGSPSCTTCPPTHFSRSTFAGCGTCIAGKFWDGRHPTECTGGVCCRKCAAGRVAPKAKSVHCTLCKDGKSASADGKGCEVCPSGRSPVPPEYRKQAHGRACGDCSPGHFAKSLTDGKCTSCPAGKFAGARSTSCKRCPEGKYQADTGANVCFSCTGNRWSARSAKKCLSCPRGRHSERLTGAAKCLATRTNKPRGAPAPTPAPRCKDGLTTGAGGSCVCKHMDVHGKWSKCNRRCGGGKRFRYRQQTSCKAGIAGLATVKLFRQVQKCHKQACPCLKEEHCDKLLVVHIPKIAARQASAAADGDKGW